jgi:hypothetical protein
MRRWAELEIVASLAAGGKVPAVEAVFEFV